MTRYWNCLNFFLFYNIQTSLPFPPEFRIIFYQSLTFIRLTLLPTMEAHQLNVAAGRALAVSCVAPSTIRAYERHWISWTQYCSDSGLDCWTTAPDDLLGFLQGIYTRCASLSNVYQHLSSVAYHFRLHGHPSPSEAPLISMYMRALKRCHVSRPQGVKRAQPLMLPDLDILGGYLHARPRSLRIWRTIWRVHLMFYCLLRWSDVATLEVSHSFNSKQPPLYVANTFLSGS